METEGVIKFDLDFEPGDLDKIDISELSAWRSIFRSLGLIGQDVNRYDGYGFGNFSMRVQDGFLITGTQTGELDELTLASYSLCTGWDLTCNSVNATGAVKPSSESLSHAAVYEVQPLANCAFHVHSPDIWQVAERMDIAITDEEVPYGTPEMAEEVRRSIRNLALPGIFSMGGHEDGIFTFGAEMSQAGSLLVETLVSAKALAR